MAILKRNFSTSGLVRIIDIGANHHVKYNNTMLFEKVFDTEIFSIDAQSAFIEEYKEYRKSTFINCAIGKTREEINFYVPFGTNENHDNNMFATSEINLIPAELKENVNRIKVTKCPLADVVPYGEFDVMFIDVEGFELDVLEGIDFTNFTFKIICIENNREPRLVNSIRIYLSNLGYEWKARIKGLDDVFIRPGNHKPLSK
jgi:FkbM family methyltransferase